jgi:hypothetical protein
MKFGFTGTQAGMTAHQKARLVTVLTYFTEGSASELAPQLHHGDCIGADWEAASIAKAMGFWIVAWPPTNSAKRGYFKSHDIHIPAPYLVRNQSIVKVTERLIAAPKTMEEEQRSGTWATIRYARKIGKPVEIIWPH